MRAMRNRSRRMIYLRPHEDEKLLATPRILRDRLIIKLLLATGMRVSELRNLHIEDIDFSTREIMIWDGKGGKDRIVFVDLDTVKMIKAYIRSRRRGALFLSRQSGPERGISKVQIQRLVHDYAKEAGLKKISCHKLRHTFAIRWVQKGGDIESLRRLLGHTVLNTTQVYLDFDDEHVRQEYDRISMIKPLRSRELEARAAAYIA